MPRLPWQRTEPELDPGPAADATADTASLGELVARVADDSGDRKD